MRRIAAALCAPLLAAVALAACGSSSSSAKPPVGANAAVKVSAGFGRVPTVTIPAKKAGAGLYFKAETRGEGKRLGSTGGFLCNYLVYIWDGTGHKLATSTYTSVPQVLSTDLLPGLKTALVGQKMGSRILAVVPPRYGYGASGNSSFGVTGTDTLVYVIDLIKAYPATASVSGAPVSDGGGMLPTVTTSRGTAPKVTIPSSAPPSVLTVTTLVKGSGPAITKGEEVVSQYVGVNWRTKTVFDSSWQRGAPSGFQIGASPATIIPGWDTGLLGVPVGSRVMLVLPPADAFGAGGNPAVGIKATDTLVYVIDILDTATPNPAR